jgi:hypothetical protein
MHFTLIGFFLLAALLYGLLYHPLPVSGHSLRADKNISNYFDWFLRLRQAVDSIFYSNGNVVYEYN